MRALAYQQPLPIDAAESILDVELPTPEPGPRDLLVRVRAVSVNPVDVKVRASAVPANGGVRVLGYDAAGVVESVGAEVTLFRPGDEVFYAGAIGRPGTNAELHLVDERIAGPKPKRLSFAEAAALPLTSITAWELLFDRLKIARGPEATGTLLIIGGAGGVGSMLTQLARKLTGLTVIASASRPQTREWSLGLGAHHILDHSRPLAEEIARLGVGAPALIASLTSTDRHFPALCEILAPQGRIAVIDDPKTLDVVPLKRKSASLHWELMFTRSIYETPDLLEQHRLLAEVSRLVDEGVLRTTMTTNPGPLSVERLKQAHALVEAGRACGKIVLEGL